MVRTVDQLVGQEIIHCVSSMVHTLASDNAYSPRDIQGATEQARDLYRGPLNYEDAARDAGWSWDTELELYWHDDEDQGYDDIEILCKYENIEPYETEVYEHWIVSDWLADKLIAKGETVDKDFMGLTIWARTTTGQAIAIDYVIQQIHGDMSR